MANQEIGNGVWHDPIDTGYIGLDLTGDIPPQAPRTIEGIELFPKQEYHCSLIAVRKYVDPAEEQTVADAVKDYLREHDLRFAGLGDERYLCRKEDRVTIVAPVRIDGIDEFFAFIKALVLKYVPPFLHVTLLKSETTEHGISVNSMEDLHRYCQKLTPWHGNLSVAPRRCRGEAIVGTVHTPQVGNEPRRLKGFRPLARIARRDLPEAMSGPLPLSPTAEDVVLLGGLGHRLVVLPGSATQALHAVDHLGVAQAVLLDEPGAHHGSGAALAAPAVQDDGSVEGQLGADVLEDRVVAIVGGDGVVTDRVAPVVDGHATLRGDVAQDRVVGLHPVTAPGRLACFGQVDERRDAGPQQSRQLQCGLLRFLGSGAVHGTSSSRVPTAVVPRTVIRRVSRVDRDTGAVEYRRERQRRALCSQGGLGHDG